MVNINSGRDIADEFYSKHADRPPRIRDMGSDILMMTKKGGEMIIERSTRMF